MASSLGTLLRDLTATHLWSDVDPLLPAETDCFREGQFRIDPGVAPQTHA